MSYPVGFNDWPEDRRNEYYAEEAKRRRERHDGGKAGERPLPPQLLPPPYVPMDVARAFVERACLSDGLLTLRHWRGGWWLWRTSCWVEVEDRVIRSVLYRFTEKAVYFAGDGLSRSLWAPTRRKIGDLLEALAAICILPADHDQPSWLDDRSTGDCRLARQWPARRRGAAASASHTAVFQPDQRALRLRAGRAGTNPVAQFLNELWPDEPDASRLLAEWFGYVISGRLDLQKIFPQRRPDARRQRRHRPHPAALIGRPNVAGPTLNSLGGEFGLAPLIGKPLAVISDARFAGRDSSTVIERLLSITGEDTLTVNRKYRDQWTGKLPCRLHIISNELPKLGDASTAIVGRILLLLTTRSWLGKEDHDLEPALQAEMTGILNWSLDGLSAPHEEREPLHPPSLGRRSHHRHARSRLALSPPLCASDATSTPRRKSRSTRFTPPTARGAEDNGHAKATKQNFGRDLRAAVPSVRVKRPRDGEARSRVYSGINLMQHVCAQCGGPPDGRDE